MPIYAMNLGATGITLGLMIGAFSISQGTVQPVVGSLSDRRGRRRFLVYVDLGFPEFIDDLLRSETPSDHLSFFLSFETNIVVGFLCGGYLNLHKLKGDYCRGLGGDLSTRNPDSCFQPNLALTNNICRYV